MMQISEPEPIPVEPIAFLRLGFRPFYLLASLFAILSIPLWVATYFNVLQYAAINVVWHMHEMVFGFAAAVVVGFLFTAVRNWTGLWTPRGQELAAFVALWLAGRFAMLTAKPLVAALLDLPFLPVAAFVLCRLIYRSGKTRNLRLVGILGLLSICNLCYHLARLEVIGMPVTKPLHAAFLLLIVLCTVMGARVIPGFTANATLAKTTSHPKTDMMALCVMSGCFISWLSSTPGAVTVALSLLGAGLHFLRMRDWKSIKTLQHPLLWILHLSYAWIGIGTALLGLASLGLASASSALHAMSVGAMSSLIVGMIARTTRGHTGQRMLSSPFDILMFSAIQIAAVVRLSANYVAVGVRPHFLIASALMWSAAFLFYIIKYASSLFRPRIDGRPG